MRKVTLTPKIGNLSLHTVTSLHQESWTLYSAIYALEVVTMTSGSSLPQNCWTNYVITGALNGTISLSLCSKKFRRNSWAPNARPRSWGNWRSFFHRSNREEHAPTCHLTIYDFSNWQTVMVEEGLPVNWNKMYIHDIDYLEYFRAPAGEK